VPDDRGVTYIGHIRDAIAERSADRLADFAFDLLYLDGMIRAAALFILIG
jgi:hypothetical protein